MSTGDDVVLTLADRGILDEKGNLDEDDEQVQKSGLGPRRWWEWE
jgi:hypothetical protein